MFSIVSFLSYLFIYLFIFVDRELNSGPHAKLSTALAMPQVLSLLAYFSDRASNFCLSSSGPNPPTSASLVGRTTGIHH
jgi:hypothetical protein